MGRQPNLYPQLLLLRRLIARSICFQLIEHGIDDVHCHDPVSSFDRCWLGTSQRTAQLLNILRRLRKFFERFAGLQRDERMQLLTVGSELAVGHASNVVGVAGLCQYEFVRPGSCATYTAFVLMFSCSMAFDGSSGTAEGATEGAVDPAFEGAAEALLASFASFSA